MTTAIVGESAVQTAVANLYGRHSWQTGLLIGRVTPKRIYVLGLVATPPQNSDDGDPAAAAGSDGGKAPAPAISATDAAKAVGDVSPSWTAVHAEQVRRTLPGGVGIVGVYCFCPSASLVSTTVRQLLMAVCGGKQTLDLDEFAEIELAAATQTSGSAGPSYQTGVFERVAVHFSSNSKDIQCRLYNAADSQGPGKSAIWSYQRFQGQWHEATCNADFDIQLAVPEPTKDKSFTHCVLKALGPQIDAIQASVVMMNGKVVPPASTLERYAGPTGGGTSGGGGGGGGKKKKGSGSSSGSTAPSKHTASIFMPPMAGRSKKLGPCKMLRVRGQVVAVAHADPKASFASFAQALKTDFARSLLARCTMLCEALEDDAEATNGVPTDVPDEAMPLRVLCRAPSGVFVSDYVFPDDEETQTFSGVLERLNGLLGMDLTRKEIWAPEVAPDVAPALDSATPSSGKQPAAQAPAASGEKTPAAANQKHSAAAGGLSMAYVAAAVALVAVLIALALMLM